MAKARLEVSFGPDFSETRTLTWEHDGLIFLALRENVGLGG